MTNPAPGVGRKKPNYTPEQRDQIFEMTRNGVSISEIAKHLGMVVKSVTGIVATARNRGLLPKMNEMPGFVPPPPQEALMNPGSGAAPAPPPLPVSSPPPVPPPAYGPPPTSLDAVRWKSSGIGHSGGFNYPNQQIRYLVRRLSPPDGVLGGPPGGRTPEAVRCSMRLGDTPGGPPRVCTYRLTPAPKRATKSTFTLSPKDGRVIGVKEPSSKALRQGARAR